MTEGADKKVYDDFLEGVDRLKHRVKREEEFLDDISLVAGGETEPEDMSSVGERVRLIREEKGLTLADVASRTGFAPDYIGRIESNEVFPPLGTLIKLGKALDMNMGYFLSGGENKPYAMVRSHQGTQIARRAASDDQKYGYTYHTLAPGKADRSMEPFLVTLEPSEEETLSSHEGQEFIYVLNGRMEVILGEDRLVLFPGDSIYYDSKIPHMVRCLDSPQARILAVLYPHDK